MSSPKKRTPKKAETKRAPNERERTAIDRAKERRKARPIRAQCDEGVDAATNELRVQAQHGDANGHSHMISETFGTTSDAFVEDALLQLANIGLRAGKPSIQALNTSLALIGAIGPEDELEAAVATQIAATHELSMEMLRRMKAAPTRDAVRDYGNLATKLQRTFTAQLKALSDWRRGGEQVVRHVHVYPGGQAVVAGTFNAGGRNENGANKPYEQGALGPEMLSYDPAGHGMPMPGNEGQETVPTTRRRDKGRGRSEGEQKR